MLSRSEKVPGDKVTDDLWVFGYGSMMWRPGFEFLESQHARLHGYHRAFCVYSHVHRGSPDRPGLVFGLDRGGSCRGIAYRVAAQEASAVIDYLRAREQVTLIYQEMRSAITLLGDEEKVKALYFIVDRNHHQYAGKIDFATQVEMIAKGVGQSGKNPEYLENTVRHMQEIGIEDKELTLLWEAVEERLGQDRP